MIDRRIFLADLALLAPSIALASPTDEQVRAFTEDLTWSGENKDPDQFHVSQLGIPLVEKDYFYRGKRIGLLGKFLHVSAQIDGIDRRYVRVAKDGTHSFYFQRRGFNEKQANKWREHLVFYRDHTDLLPHYSVDAALLFASWVVSVELAPALAFTASTVGLYELGINLFNDYRRVKDAGHMIDTVNSASSFIFTQLEFNPSDPQHCTIGVFYQSNPDDRAIPLWAQSYHPLLPFTEPALAIQGWA